MLNFNCAKDLHRKGELEKVDLMESLAEQLEKKTKGGLVPAYITNGFFDCDAFAMLPTKPEFENQSGNVVYNLDEDKPMFILDSEVE